MEQVFQLAAQFDNAVRSVAMQSTGVYWMPVFEVLEQHGLEVYLVNARHTKNVPTAEAALASFAYVMATLAPSAARRLAIAAPMPREPPVMSAIFPSSFLVIVFSPIPLISFLADPVAYVGRAVKNLVASCFTSPE